MLWKTLSLCICVCVRVRVRVHVCVCVCVWKPRRAVRRHTRVYGTSNTAALRIHSDELKNRIRIIVTPHFVVSNGNGVITGETVISLITRYWKQ